MDDIEKLLEELLQITSEAARGETMSVVFNIKDNGDEIRAKEKQKKLKQSFLDMCRNKL